MAVRIPDGPTCGCMGCTEPADYRVKTHAGERVVCDRHASGMDVISDV